MTFQFSPGQQNAMDKFLAFLMDPSKHVFRLEGYAGTGKSTLVKELLDRLPKFMEAMRLTNPNEPEYEIVLTATTNKAAEVLSQMSGMDCSTIHSYLGFRVNADYKTGETNIWPTNKDGVYFKLLFIDEASFIDWKLKKLIFDYTHNCKIVFMGDRAQLAPVKCNGVPPVFQAEYEGAMLTEVMRQMVDGKPQVNAITELATAFREVVNGGPWPKIQDYTGDYVKAMKREEFEAAFMKELTRSDWRYVDSKILAWTNKTVIAYNHQVSTAANGRPHIEAGDYAVCNKVVMVGNKKISTDQLVHVSKIFPESEEYGCKGNIVLIDETIQTFFPKSIDDRKAAFNKAKADNDWTAMRAIDMEWIDLRHAYAQTVNKSQGSTYGRVFIDLADIMKCNSGDQIARMLYVAVSRAKHEVIFLKGK